MPDTPPMTVADYKWLTDSLMGSDSAALAQAHQVIKNLTPQEGTDFVNYQKGRFANAQGGKTDAELTRTDNQVLGMPPELAAIGAVRAGAAMADSAGGLATKAWAGLKSIGAQAAPVAKYQIVKSALDAAGVPQSVSIPTAMVFSGYRMSTAKAAEAGLTAEQQALLDTIEKRNAAIASREAATPATTPQASNVMPMPPKVPISADAFRMAQQWRAQGIPEAEIMARIRTTNALISSPSFSGLPTISQAMAAVAARAKK